MKFIIWFSILSTVSAYAQNYTGSSFNETWSVVRDIGFKPATQEEADEFGVYQARQLPYYPVNSYSIFANGSGPLKRDAVRTVSERFDYYDRLPKKLHPNGICLAGTWKITKPTSYTGALATGFDGLIVGRVSVAMEETEKKGKRGFGFAGKVFPTLDKNKIVSTGNFFSVDVLMGTRLDHALDAKTTNEPETGFQFGLIGLGLRIASALSSADSNPGFRPLTQLAEINGYDLQAIQPRWIRISADSTLVKNDEADFRNEILRAMHDNKKLKYFIDVSDSTKDRNSDQWVRIGEINAYEVALSYGCDRRLHFSHPKLN